MDMILDKVELFNKEIQYQSNFNKNPLIKVWKIERLEWKKNRLIFEEFFIKKNFKLKDYLKILEYRKIDINFLFLWKKSFFRLLCSPKIIRGNFYNLNRSSVCRIPLKNRSNEMISKVQLKTGCIYCLNNMNLNEPIWWDQMFLLISILKESGKKKYLKHFLSKNFSHSLFMKKKFDFNIILLNIKKIFTYKLDNFLRSKKQKLSIVFTKKDWRFKYEKCKFLINNREKKK
jgi:hypothetical protein